jgi:hypothetical protein
VEVGGEIRYGRSIDVPSRLDGPTTGVATVVLLAGPDPDATADVLAALERLALGVDVVVVADNVDAPPTDHEVVRTSALLGAGATLNFGIRRARGEVVVVLDPSIVPIGDLVSPLVQALADRSVAVVGSAGYTSADMQRFETVEPLGDPLDVAAIRGPLLAFRRAEAAARLPVDEAFRVDEYLDIWWSLVLRDAGEGGAPRRAVAIPGLPLRRVAPRAPRPGSDRPAKRNFYRVLDRFRTRLDLAVPAGP